MAVNTRHKIIEKAEELLLYRGYEGTSLNDVVEEAGVSKGAFFHYYPNKQAVSQQVTGKYARERLIEPLQKHLSSSGSAKEALRGWIAAFYESYKKQDFRGGCLLGNMALELSDQSEDARAAIKGYFLELENTLASALKPEQEKMAMEPRQFARLLIAAFEGVILTTKAHKDHNRAGREFQALGQLIELGIRE